MRWFVGLFWAAMVASCAPSGNVGNDRLLGSGINGGDKVESADPISMGTVFIYSSRGNCSGTLIDKNWVLTAAHCIKGWTEPVAEVEVRFGVDPFDNPPILRSRELFPHHLYDSFDPIHTFYDIALIKISDAPEGFVPVRLAPEAPQKGDLVTVAGFGRGGDRVLNRVDLTVLESERSTSLRIAMSSEQGFCSGDSGGSVYDQQMNLVGIPESSETGGCQGPGRATSVSFFYDWIFRSMELEFSHGSQ